MSAPSTPVWMRSKRPLVLYAASAAAILAFLLLFSDLRSALAPPKLHCSHTIPDSFNSTRTTWRFNPATDSRNLGLTDEQCDVAFPKLFSELDKIRDHLGPASVHRKQVKIHTDREPYPHGQLHVLIYNGHMSVINEMKGACDRSRGLAGLANLYRAITAVADPSTIPNVEFILDIEDTPTTGVPDDRVVWAWNRPMTNLNTFVAPDFDGWAFPKQDLGSYFAFRERLQFTEDAFADKDPRAVWRGSMNNEVRTALVEAAEGKPWSDVQMMTAETRLHMAEFCKYQFPVHTEGNTWSGRLRYMQNCNSVSVIHQPLKYQAHYYDLLVADGPDQNYIAVKNDFTDLHDKIEYYRAHPDVAARVAKNSVATFRDRYLTPAAEACYWRRMIRNWAEVQAFEPAAFLDVKNDDGSKWKTQRGVDWEVFAHPDGKYNYEFPEDKN